MVNGPNKVSFPWWYSFIKWLIPIMLCITAALWVGFSLVGIIPIPVSFGMISWAPVLFSQLDKIAAFSVLMFATGGILSTVGFISWNSTKGFLLSVAEDVAVRAQNRISSLEQEFQIKTAGLETQLAQRDDDLREQNVKFIELLAKCQRLVGRIEQCTGERVPEDIDDLILPSIDHPIIPQNGVFNSRSSGRSSPQIPLTIPSPSDADAVRVVIGDSRPST